MSDILIEIDEITRGEKLLEIKDIEKIKHNIDEIDLFSLQEILKEEEESVILIMKILTMIKFNIIYLIIHKNWL